MVFREARARSEADIVEAILAAAALVVAAVTLAVAASAVAAAVTLVEAASAAVATGVVGTGSRYLSPCGVNGAADQKLLSAHR